MKILSTLIASIFLFSQTFFAQVWPGDVNNNGVVTEVDILYLGYAYGATGPARATVDSTWAAQEISDLWVGSFPDGLNFAYADCNGDGLVDEADITVIEQNRKQTHDDVPFVPDEILEAIPGADPKFAFASPTFSISQTGQGEGNLDMVISLGDNISVENLTGIAFTIEADPAIISPNRTSFKFSNDSWINADENAIVRTFKDKDGNDFNGKHIVAYTRKDQQPISGSGEIGELSFVIITDAIDLLVTDTLRIAIDSITVTDDNFELTPIEPADIKLNIKDSMLITKTYEQALDKIILMPNPNHGKMLIRSVEIDIDKAEIINILGQKVWVQKFTPSRYQRLDFQHLPAGTYWLHLYTAKGIKSELIYKLHNMP